MIVCVDVGATNIKSALLAESDRGVPSLVDGPFQVPTDADGGRRSVCAAFERAVSLCLRDGVTSVAVCSAGDVDPKRAVITYATQNLPGMTGFDFREFIDAKFGLPSCALNDAQAALLGEMQYGAGRDYRDRRVVMLTLGSGVGGGYYAEGRLVSDSSNDYARYGHLCLQDNGIRCTCGKKGCIEVYLSGRALHRDAKIAGVEEDLFLRFGRGSAAHVAFVGEFRQRLAASLRLIYEKSPFDLCLLGGGVADWMGDNFSSVVNGVGYTVRRAELGNCAGMYGAMAFALQGGGDLYE